MIDNKTRLRRLRRLKKIMEMVPAAKFDIETWGCEKKRKYRGVLPAPIAYVKCNTTACALGWAGLDKQFRKEGLCLDVEDNEVRFQPIPKSNYYHTGSRAGARFFGLKLDEACNLFGLLWYGGDYSGYYGRHLGKVKPKHVVLKIQELIEKYKASVE